MAEKFDFKKEYKDLYLPKTEPALVTMRAMPFLMVDGAGDPNTSEAYQEALELLYGFSFTIKMSPKTGKEPPGYFDYVVPPLEGLWMAEEGGFAGGRIMDKSKLLWTSMIRQPDFVTMEVFDWAFSVLKKKKPALPVEKVRLEVWEEGLCVQLLHIGPYDAEPASVAKLDRYAAEHGFAVAIGDPLPNGGVRRHHEIYLGDPRRTAPEKLRTVIRHPVKRL